MSEAGNSMNLEKRTICHVLNLDVNKIHNLNHKKIAENLFSRNPYTESSNILRVETFGKWNAEDCHIIMSYMCDMHHKSRVDSHGKMAIKIAKLLEEEHNRICSEECTVEEDAIRNA